MKIKNIRNAVAVVLFIISLMQLTSCKKYESVAPIPKIDGFDSGSSSENTIIGVTGAPVIIRGSNFSSNLSENLVKFNGVVAVVTSATPTELNTVVPEQATTGKIAVTVNGQTTISETDFVVSTSPIPFITSFSPATGFPQQEGDIGTTVRISGSNFSSTVSPNPTANVVKFNGTPAIVVNASKSLIEAIVPPGATSGKISVLVNGVTATSTTDFIVRSTSEILITGWQGNCSNFVIVGKNFSQIPSENDVRFNGASAVVTASTKTQITTTFPANATTGRITVTVNGHTGIAPADIIIPEIREFAPGIAVEGATVTLTGENIAGFQYVQKNSLCHEVKFNGVVAVVTAVTENQLVVVVPVGATTGKITISGNGRTTTSLADFIVAPIPVVNSFAPESGPAGTTVAITGSGFIPDISANEVKFNGVSAIVSQATTTQLIVKVPVNATSGRISVNHPGGNAGSVSDFIVVAPSFTFSPVSAPPGMVIAITGSGFSPTLQANTVNFNGVQATIVNASANMLNVLVPQGATSGRITVTVNGVPSLSTTDFIVINAPAVIINIQPASGYADRPGTPGTRIVINGMNFSQLPFENIIRFANGVNAPVIFSSPSRLEAIVPPGALSGPITVMVNGVPSVGQSTFTVLQP